MKSADIRTILLAAAGVVVAGALISWARGSNVPLLGDIAGMAHDGFDG
jgi:hypothetical protein